MENNRDQQVFDPINYLETEVINFDEIQTLIINKLMRDDEKLLESIELSKTEAD